MLFWLQNFPTGHVTRSADEATSPGQKDPLGHLSIVSRVKLVESQIYPVGQGEQSACFSKPVPLEKVPAGHGC